MNRYKVDLEDLDGKIVHQCTMDVDEDNSYAPSWIVWKGMVYGEDYPTEEHWSRLEKEKIHIYREKVRYYHDVDIEQFKNKTRALLLDEKEDIVVQRPISTKESPAYMRWDNKVFFRYKEDPEDKELLLYKEIDKESVLNLDQLK